MVFYAVLKCKTSRIEQETVFEFKYENGDGVSELREAIFNCMQDKWKSPYIIGKFDFDIVNLGVIAC